MPMDLGTVRQSATRNRGVNLLADLVTVRKSASIYWWDKSAGRCVDCQKIYQQELGGKICQEIW